MKTKPPIRVLVCDDVSMVRRGVQLLLESSPEFVVVGGAADGDEAIRQARELKPDLVLMDVRMPASDGAQATREIVQQDPDIKVLAYSSDSSWETVDKMLVAGAAGYLVKGPDPEELVRAARTVIAGGHYLSLALLEPAGRD